MNIKEIAAEVEALRTRCIFEEKGPGGGSKDGPLEDSEAGYHWLLAINALETAYFQFKMAALKNVSRETSPKEGISVQIGDSSLFLSHDGLPKHGPHRGPGAKEDR